MSAGEGLDGVDELVLHRVLKRVAGLLNHSAALDFDHRLLNVGVDPSEHAREQVIAEQHRFGGDRLAVVIPLVKLNHRVGHGGEEVTTGERNFGGRHSAFSLVLRVGARARQKNENQTSYLHTIAPAQASTGVYW